MSKQVAYPQKKDSLICRMNPSATDVKSKQGKGNHI